MNSKKIFTISAFLSLILSSSFAEKITFSADTMSGTAGSKSDSTTLTGNAYVKTESMEISADSITMSGKDFRYIEAKGDVKGKNTESQLDFTAVSLKYDRETKIAELSGNVDLTDTKNNVNAKAQLIEYDQNTDIAVMQIDISLTQKDNVCSGVYAVYRKNQQLLELSGNAQIKQGQDTFRAQEITLNLDSQEITLDGRVKGSVVDERKTEPENQEKPEIEKQSENEKPDDHAGKTDREKPDDDKPQPSENGNDKNQEKPAMPENDENRGEKH